MRKYFFLLFVLIICENYHFQPLLLKLNYESTIMNQSYKDYSGYTLGLSFLQLEYNFDLGGFISYNNTTLVHSKIPIGEGGAINTILIGCTFVYYAFNIINFEKLEILPKVSLNIGYDLKNYSNYSGNISDYYGTISKIFNGLRIGLSVGFIFKPSDKIYLTFEIGYELRHLEIAYTQNINETEVLSYKKNINLNTDKINLGLMFPL